MELYDDLITIDANGKKVRMRHNTGVNKNASVYIDIHGGGWAWGYIENGDHLRQNICDQLGREAYSIEYTLVPDAFYPTQVNALYEIIDYIRIHLNDNWW